MPRYIDVVEVIYDGDKMKAMPAADVEEVKHGHFILRNVRFMPYSVAEECSECHSWGLIQTFKRNYCPNCGAKMDGKENEK